MPGDLVETADPEQCLGLTADIAGLLAAIDAILAAGRATGELRSDVTAEDIAASLIGIFTVTRPLGHDARASRLLNILMDGLRPPP